VTTATDELGLEAAERLARAATELTEAARQRMVELTEGGRQIDAHQVTADRVAYAATEARAASELVALVRGDEAPGLPVQFAVAGAADLAKTAHDRIWPVVEQLGLGEETLAKTYPDEVRQLLRRALSDDLICALGRSVAEQGGKVFPALDEMHDEVRRSVRQFADKEIAPHAEHIHRHDDLVPERFIEQIGELGYFGMSVPEQYGGAEMGNLAMILTTEELSRASLASGGSLITRPEILTKALLAGGTDEQKSTWLPKIATGELMVAISVTEPNVGSDVASVSCKATPGEVDGKKGYLIDGAKAWCTFAGRADVIALLVRTNPDSSAGAKGLSLFVVPKPRFEGHEFEVKQDHGGTLVGKADATVGYRGMHSFTLGFENFFVPAENLVGLDKGQGRGFYLQMAGFAAGRLQTGGRACGVGQAALEVSCDYVNQRVQFKKPTIEFQLTQYKLGRMAARLAAARAITYTAARAMDEDERVAAPLAAQAKLLSCDVAVEITQDGQLLHGGWGYAEEYPISRYVVDALVLPIFEGVKPILSLKVVARSLFAS